MAGFGGVAVGVPGRTQWQWVCKRVRDGERGTLPQDGLAGSWGFD